METLRLVVDSSRLDAPESVQAITKAADILRGGGLVALPTETVYGLGANALDPNAVARIFAAKKRPAWDPVIVHIAGPVFRNPMLKVLVKHVEPRVLALIGAFWPGPLTLLLPRSAAVPDAVTAGRPLVGVRMPAHPVALELIRIAGVPVAAPSANVFGHISPTTAEHVLQDLDGRIDAIVDAGPTRHGVESTVLDPNQNPMMIYRPGAITAEQIRDVGGPVVFFEENMLPMAVAHEALPSPGVGIRHYAPRAKLILIEAPLEALTWQLRAAARRYAGNRVGFMLPTELSPDSLGHSEWAHAEWIMHSWGSWNDPEALARNLYAGLRALDAENCTVILCPMPPETGIGTAMRDRLRKAARAES